MRRVVLSCLCLASLAVSSQAIAQGASARLAYDAANLALNGGDGYQSADNKTGTLAWGESYVMMSYAAMFRATSDPAYLIALAKHARSVLDRRDSVLGWKDYKGKSRSCWQSTKYSDNNEPFCWVVHSGMITYPMADLVRIVGKDPALQSIPVPWGGTLGEASQQVLAEVHKTIATHEFEWKVGPAAGEGHYIGDPDAPIVSVAGKALPLNQMNALGMTLAAVADGTADADAEHKAKGMCAYLRHRMSADGPRMVWTYWGDAWTGAGKGEDISHAALNVEFASLCRARGWSFTDADMVRIARTLFEKVHIDSDTAWDRIDGTGTGNTYRTAVGRWLTIAPFEPRVWAIGANAYRKTDPTPGGSDLHALSLIALHAPPVRAHTFYHVDWSDLGDYRKATAYGANILMNPPATDQRYVIKLQYRANRAASVEQWDGDAYHPNIRLSAAANTDTGWVPYDPSIYQAYSGTSALYQFDDAFVAGQGIEVLEAAEVLLPSITTDALAGGTVGQPWSATVSGAGDPPLLWSIVQAPPGMTIGLKTGELAWTPSSADTPTITLTLMVRNDSGAATRSFTLAVAGQGAADASADGAADSGSGSDGSGSDVLIESAQADGSQTDSSDIDGSTDGSGWGAESSNDGCSCRAAGQAMDAPAGWIALAAIVMTRGAISRRRLRPQRARD